MTLQDVSCGLAFRRDLEREPLRLVDLAQIGERGGEHRLVVGEAIRSPRAAVMRGLAKQLSARLWSPLSRAMGRDGAEPT